MTDHGTSRDSLADTARKRRTRTISVLVVDPDQQEREVTRRMLADRGYHVICVGDTRAALWQMINEDVDVAFVDLSIGTPVHWFRQIVSQFRPWQRGVLTGHIRPEALEESLRECPYLQKPLGAELTCQSIEREALEKTALVQKENADYITSSMERLSALFRHAQASLAKGGMTSFLNGLGHDIEKIIDCDLAAVLDTAAGERRLSIILKKPVAPSFVKSVKEQMHAAYQALTNESLHSVFAEEQLSGAPCSEGAPSEAADIFTFPVVINDELEGFLTLASNQPRLYSSFNLAFLYQAIRHFPQALPGLKELRRMTICDSFTGLYNRQYFETKLKEMWQEAAQNGGNFALLIVDVDGFKRINDHYGHEVGDRIIIELARLFQESARKTDIVARYGGDELVVLLPRTDQEQSYFCARRFLDAVQQHVFCQDSTPLHLTISMGIAVNLADGIRDMDMITLADRAMYRSKEKGGDQAYACWDLQTPLAKSSGRRPAAAVSARAAEAPLQVKERGGGRGNVMVVDDDPAICRIFQEILREKGFDMEVFVLAREALRRISQDPDSVEVILTDVNMPEMDGNELLRETQRIAPLAVTIMVTGFASHENVISALRGGAYDFIKKPVDFDELEFVLDRAVEHQRTRAQLRDYQLHLEERLYEKSASLRNAYLGTMEALSTVLSVRESNTAQHNRRVSAYAVLLARQMGMPEAEIETLRRAAVLHDIGKIGVPDAILLKPDSLDADERAIMQLHATAGYSILNEVPFLREEAELVYAHHEYYDGSGYPRGLKGEAIPLGARIFAVADAYDALRSDRVYRQALPPIEAAAEIKANAGTQFDPEVVRIFLEHCTEIEIEVEQSVKPEERPFAGHP